MNIRFPAVGIDSLMLKFDQLGLKRTPFLCFGDVKFGKILYAFFPTPQHTSKTTFLEKVKGFLNYN
jgi:hypothetical protein